MRLAALLVISLVVATAGLLVVRFVDGPMATHITMFATAALWLALLIVTLVVHGKRGLWLLVGAPFALFVPLLWAWFYFVCGCSIYQEEGDQSGCGEDWNRVVIEQYEGPSKFEDLRVSG